jgi:hypothetical protein
MGVSGPAPHCGIAVIQPALAGFRDSARVLTPGRLRATRLGNHERACHGKPLRFRACSPPRLRSARLTSAPAPAPA